jgi:hypothetical protein
MKYAISGLFDGDYSKHSRLVPSGMCCLGTCFTLNTLQVEALHMGHSLGECPGCCLAGVYCARQPPLGWDDALMLLFSFCETLVFAPGSPLQRLLAG